ARVGDARRGLSAAVSIFSALFFDPEGRARMRPKLWSFFKHHNIEAFCRQGHGRTRPPWARADDSYLALDGLSHLLPFSSPRLRGARIEPARPGWDKT